MGDDFPVAESIGASDRAVEPSLLTAAAQSPVALLLVDQECVITEANPATSVAAGQNPVGQRFCSVFRSSPCGDRDGGRCPFAYALLGQEQRARPRWTTLEVGGLPYPVLLGVAPLPSHGVSSLNGERATMGATVTMIPSNLVDEADRKRREMIAAAVHDIRHPVTVQTLVLELLTGTELVGLSPAVRALVARLRRTTAYLATSVDELLNRMLFDLGTMTIRPIMLEIGPVLEQVAWSLEPVLERRHQRVKLQVAPSLWVWGDPGALEHVFMNLLLNAHKYSVERDEIVIIARRRRGHEQVEVTVRDHGPGIPRAERRRVFERFFRGAQSAGQRGAGLGLTIVGAIVDQLGGTVTLRGPAGGGLAVCVRLPTQSPDSPAPIP